MVTTIQPKAKTVHPLTRFVTPEAIALILNLPAEDIYRIDCWRYVIHVVGKGISTFLSYADIPPVVGVAAPSPQDILLWRKRWRKNKYKAPSFWLGFYASKFQQATSWQDLSAWSQLLPVIKFGLSEIGWQWLHSIYTQRKEFYLLSK